MPNHHRPTKMESTREINRPNQIIFPKDENYCVQRPSSLEAQKEMNLL